jgi:hypothetical protein
VTCAEAEKSNICGRRQRRADDLIQTRSLRRLSMYIVQSDLREF